MYASPCQVTRGEDSVLGGLIHPDLTLLPWRRGLAVRLSRRLAEPGSAEYARRNAVRSECHALTSGSTGRCVPEGRSMIDVVSRSDRGTTAVNEAPRSARGAAR